MNIQQIPSPNYNERKMPGSTKAIVIHWTAGVYMPSVQWLCKPESQVSAHFVVDIAGENIAQLVPLAKRAWHCGGSYHPLLLSDTNSATVGIEIEGPPSMVSSQGWGSKLIGTLGELCKYIKAEVPEIEGIVDHSTIAPLQKQDVKKGIGKDVFPWDFLVIQSGLKDYSIDEYAKQIRFHFGMNQ